MNLGYDRALYLLPFDHRRSFVADMFGFELPLSAQQRDQVTDSWLAIASAVPGFIGFAVGRTSFWDAVSSYRAQTLSRTEAATQIARRFREWVDLFEAGRKSRPAVAA